MYLSVYISIYLYIFLYLFSIQSIQLLPIRSIHCYSSIYPSIYPSIHLSIYLSLYLFLSFNHSIYPFVYFHLSSFIQSIHPSIHPCISHKIHGWIDKTNLNPPNHTLLALGPRSRTAWVMKSEEFILWIVHLAAHTSIAWVEHLEMQCTLTRRHLQVVTCISYTASCSFGSSSGGPFFYGSINTASTKQSDLKRQTIQTLFPEELNQLNKEFWKSSPIVPQTTRLPWKGASASSRVIAVISSQRSVWNSSPRPDTEE